MKCCPVVPEICRGQVHGARKERRITRTRTRTRIIIIIRRNGAKTISLQTLFGRLNNNKKRSKNNKSPKQTISLPNFVWETYGHLRTSGLIPDQCDLSLSLAYFVKFTCAPSLYK